jgi:hypothetical protein
MPPFWLKNFCSGRFLAFSLTPEFICYFLRLLNILVIWKWKYLLLLFKETYNGNKLPWSKWQNKIIWVQHLDLQNLSENYCVEILKNFNSDKKMLNVLLRISQSIKFKILLAKTHGLCEKCDKFCAEINCTYNTCVE